MCEIAVELLYTKAMKRERSFSTKEYDGFYEKKAEQSLKLDQLKDSTRKKIKAVTFKILREAELLTDSNEIMQQFIGKKVGTAIKKDDSLLLRIYPVF
jgi:hypothetical protein